MSWKKSMKKRKKKKHTLKTSKNKKENNLLLLKSKCWQKLLALRKEEEENYQKTLEKELNIIEKLNYTDYLLVISDVVNHLKKKMSWLDQDGEAPPPLWLLIC